MARSSSEIYNDIQALEADKTDLIDYSNSLNELAQTVRNYGRGFYNVAASLEVCCNIEGEYVDKGKTKDYSDLLNSLANEIERIALEDIIRGEIPRIATEIESLWGEYYEAKQREYEYWVAQQKVEKQAPNVVDIKKLPGNARQPASL